MTDTINSIATGIQTVFGPCIVAEHFDLRADALGNGHIDQAAFPSWEAAEQWGRDKFGIRPQSMHNLRAGESEEIAALTRFNVEKYFAAMNPDPYHGKD